MHNLQYRAIAKSLDKVKGVVWDIHLDDEVFEYKEHTCSLVDMSVKNWELCFDSLKLLENGKVLIKMHREAIKRNRRVKDSSVLLPPPLASVLASLLSDAELADMPMLEFFDLFGYNTDSIADRQLHLDICQFAQKVRRLNINQQELAESIQEPGKDEVLRNQLKVRVKFEPYFSITATKYDGWKIDSCGCLHEEITETFPELRPYLKWNVFNYAPNPMYYISNSMFHASRGDLESARRSAVWPEAELKDFTEEQLKHRLPALIQDFNSDMETLRTFFYHVSYGRDTN